MCQSHSLELDILNEIPIISENEYCEFNYVDIRDELDKISVVQAFPQVFSEDFPSVLTKCEIVSEILLQSGCVPIFVPHIACQLSR